MQKVANIEPGKQIDINIRYYHTLSHSDGWYEFVFPMVVGPRFNPPWKNDGIGAVARGRRGASSQSAEVQYLSPAERSGHDISLSVMLDAGMPIEAITAINHKVQIDVGETGKLTDHAKVTLAADDSIPNKDFVLRYKLAGATAKSALFTSHDKHGDGYFTLLIMPPASLFDLPRQPLEMVFTLDVSGSMAGRPIEQSKAAVRYALAHMDQRDTFQVIRFGDRAEKLFDKPVEVTPSNVRHAIARINGMSAGGGTYLVDGLRASLDFPHDENRLRFVSFLTDGFIGNEAEALREIHNLLGPARIFSFGVGSSTNRYLMEHMAKLGRGAAAYLSLNENAEDVMRPFFERISHPAMTDLSLDFGGVRVSEVYPQHLPDLFVGRPVIVTGRFRGEMSGPVKLRGRIGGRACEVGFSPHEQGFSAATGAVASIWARARIADLLDSSVWQPAFDTDQQIKRLALRYALASPFTAFLAVDSTAPTAGDHGVSITVPVPVPDGARYETTVPGEPGRVKK
jgi:Ca-activated chloride channel family protein